MKSFGVPTGHAVSLNHEAPTGHSFPGGQWHCGLPRVNPADRYKLPEPDKSPLTFASVREWVRWETSGEGRQCVTDGSHTS